MYRSYFLTSKLSQVFSVGLFLWYLRSTMLPAVRRFGLGSGVASSAYAAYQYNTDDDARRAMQMWDHFGPVALHYRLVEAKQARVPRRLRRRSGVRWTGGTLHPSYGSSKHSRACTPSTDRSAQGSPTRFQILG